MARADYSYQDALDPTEPRERLAEVYDSPVAPPPPTEPHPMVSFAQRLLSPITTPTTPLNVVGQFALDAFGEISGISSRMRGTAIQEAIGSRSREDQRLAGLRRPAEVAEASEAGQSEFMGAVPLVGVGGTIGRKAIQKAPKVADEAAKAVRSVTDEVPGVLKTAEQLVAERFPKLPPHGEDFAGSINLNKLNVTDEAKTILRANAEDLPPQTHAQTLDLANDVVESARLAGVTPEEFAVNFAKRFPNPEDAVALRIMTAKATETAAAVVRDGVKAGLSPEALFNSEKAILTQLTLQDSLNPVAHKSGQLLDAYKIVVDTPYGKWDEALSKLGQVQTREEFVKRLATIDPADSERISKFIRDVELDLAKQNVKPVNVGWWLNHVYMNGLLSGLSNVRNAVGNTLKVGKTIAELYGSVDAGTPAGRPRGIALESANAFTAAMFTRGISRGTAKMLDSFIHRIPDGQKFDQPLSAMYQYPQNPIGARTADIIGLPGRAMVAMDGMFKGMFSEGYIGLRAHEDAVKAGLRGKAKADFIADYFVNPSREVIEDARKFADEYTFTREPGEKTQAAITLNNRLKFTKVFMPFIGTPANIYRDAIQSTPLGLPPIAKLLNKASFGAVGEPGKRISGTLGEAETAMRYSRAILGTGVLLGAYTQIVEGNITGFNPYRPGTTEWELWNKDNVELGIKIPGGPQVSLLNYAPVSTLLKFAASVKQAQEKYGTESITPQYIAATMLRLARTGLDESFLDGASGVFSAIENPDRFGKDVWTRLVSLPIPWSSALRLANQVRGLPPRDPQTWQEYLAVNIPLVGDDIRPKLGAFGPIEPRTNTGLAAAIPSLVREPHASPAERELLALDAYARANSLTFAIPEPATADLGRGKKLSDEHLYALKQTLYPKMLDATQAVMSAPDYFAQPERERMRRLNEAWDKARDEGRRELAWNTLLPASKTADDVATAALLGLSTVGSLKEKAYWLEDIQKAGKMTPEAARIIDLARPPVKPGEKPQPTVAEYLRDAPLIHQYLQTRPYTIGNPDEWRALAVARKKAADYAKSNPKPAGMSDWQWLYRVDPQSAELVRRYSYAWVKNPKRAELLKKNPQVARYVQ